MPDVIMQAASDAEDQRSSAYLAQDCVNDQTAPNDGGSTIFPISVLARSLTVTQVKRLDIIAQPALYRLACRAHQATQSLVHAEFHRMPLRWGYMDKHWSRQGTPGIAKKNILVVYVITHAASAE